MGSPAALTPSGVPAGTNAAGARVVERFAVMKMPAATMTTAAAVPASQSHGRGQRRGGDGVGRAEDGRELMQREYNTVARSRPGVSVGIFRLWLVMAVLVLAGLADSAYLTWYHYDPAVRVCLASGGCEAVNGSRFATLGGVPVAVIGVAGYVLIAATLAVRRWGPPGAHRPAGQVAYALAAAGTAFSLYLTAVEAFVLRAYCTWCLVSAALITALCIVATVDLAVSDHF